MYNKEMQKDFQLAIGMMSGTSLDGIDACLVKIYKDFKFEVLATNSLEYPKDVLKKLLKIANNNGTTEEICYMDFIIGKLFAQCAKELIKKSKIPNDDIDFIASHGQTIFHIPQKVTIGNISTRSTLQIGNISVIAQETGITTVGDFRSKDIAAGGQGAPLVPFADELIFKREIPRCIQNIGGIGNVTVLSPTCKTFAFDTGPGNMLIDYYTQKLFNESYDQNGEFAQKGKINNKWLDILLNEPYYQIQPPKSTGRELFNKNYAEKMLEYAPENKYDIIATITDLTAITIANAYKNFIFPKTEIKEIVLGGGGAYNNYLIKRLKYHIKNIPIKTHNDFGINDKNKEAISFALLGYCTINKQPNNIPDCTGAEKKVIMGLISYV